MKINGEYMRSIRLNAHDPRVVEIFDQRFFPYQMVVEPLRTRTDAARAIREMLVRGAPLIGITAAYGMYLAALHVPEGRSFHEWMVESAALLKATRPTAVNLMWAVDVQMAVVNAQSDPVHATIALLENAHKLADEDAEMCRMIGVHGLPIIEEIAQRKKGPVNVLTHCNAGWLACVDWGTATSPLYQAFDKGIDLHVYVDETRPRNQGARLTAFELGQHGIPHTVIPDNAGGHLMQHGMVDFCIVGTDRTTRSGDVANKIGTYLKALAAKANNVPFYVALPSSTFDPTIRDGVHGIEIETRSDREVKYIEGWDGTKIQEVLLTPESSPAVNYGFDVTPAHLVSALITERGMCPANEEGILNLFPEFKDIPVKA